MARYIDAEKIELAWYVPDVGYLTDYQKKHNELSTYAQGVIDSAPTADVAPVIHAHWIEDCGDYKCSHCSTEFWDEMVFIVRTSEHEFPNYCPVCGAKMDEEVDDEKVYHRSNR